MDKKKYERDILLFFRDYSNQELLDKISENIYFYRRLKKIEPFVIEILNKYGAHYFRNYESFKVYFAKVLYCAKLRGLKYRNVEYRIKIDDIIEMIYINRDLEIDNVLENFSYYFGYLGNNNWNNFDNISFDTDTGLDIKVSEIKVFYEQIINAILSETKRKQKIK